MLSKEHLRYGVSEGACKPYFLKATSQWETLAQDLLQVGNESKGLSYGELLEQWLVCEASAGRYRKAAKGLRSIIEKKVEFEALDELQLESQRWQAWQLQIQNLRDAKQCPPFPLQAQLHYADLESRRKISSTPKWSAAQLLHRYNLALTQGLLLHAERLQCELPGASPKTLRYFWRYLKFFGLLVRQQPNLKVSGSLQFNIEGPLQECGAHLRYRTRMAAVVGVLPHLVQWKLKAELVIDKVRFSLVLDEQSGLRSHYQPFFDYIPEELKVFTDSVKSELKDWVAEEPVWPSLPQQEWNIPDLYFRHPDGRSLNIFVYFASQKETFQRHLKNPSLPEPQNRTIIFAERSMVPKGDVPQNLISFSSIPSSRSLMSHFKKWPWI
jgi:uncharacterized protein